MCFINISAAAVQAKNTTYTLNTFTQHNSNITIQIMKVAFVYCTIHKLLC